MRYAVALTLALIVALAATPPVAQPISDEIQIRVTATGTANPLSKGNEVWVMHAPGLDTNREYKGWEKRGTEVLVSYGDNRGATLSWTIAPGPSDTLILHKHPYSGIVEISVNGTTETHDLYSPNDEKLTINLAPDSREKWKEVQFNSIFTPLSGRLITLPAPKREGTGGAVTSVGDNAVVLTHDGTIYIVPPTLQPIESSIAPPYNGFDAYAADSKRPPYDSMSHNFANFRYNDIQFVRTQGHVGFAVSYTKYHAEKKCYTTTLSFLHVGSFSTPIDQWKARSEDWVDIFDTKPCLPLKNEWRAIEGHMAGGRIAFDGKDTLYLASGDYAWDGIYGPLSPYANGVPVAQDPSTGYGKVVQLNLETGVARTLARGLRNVQGIGIDRTGQVWTVEHGMRGGDELNRISAGENFGWPFESYGTLYSGMPIPSVRSHGRHENFTKPIYAWLPSIAVSGLDRIENFHDAWDGDLIVATLAGMKLVRLRIEDGRVIFAEDIVIGKRIRDVYQHSSGELILWTDSRELIFLRPNEEKIEYSLLDYVLKDKMDLPPAQRSRVEEALDTCLTCHTLGRSDDARAPSLARVFGSQLGSTNFKGYSRALRESDKRWDEENLRSFIKSPTNFLPGTTMPTPNIQEDTVVDLLISVLQHLARTIEPFPER
jgi:cytochrome c2